MLALFLTQDMKCAIEIVAGTYTLIQIASSREGLVET